MQCDTKYPLVALIFLSSCETVYNKSDWSFSRMVMLNRLLVKCQHHLNVLPVVSIGAAINCILDHLHWCFGNSICYESTAILVTRTIHTYNWFIAGYHSRRYGSRAINLSNKSRPASRTDRNLLEFWSKQMGGR